MKVKLKKIIKKNDLTPVVEGLISSIGEAAVILDAEGGVILGSGAPPPVEPRHPVLASGEVIGWVAGGEKVAPLASLLGVMAAKETEVKTLARETLDKYKEITLLYGLSEKISTCLDVESLAKLVLKEAEKTIRCDSGSVMVLDDETGEITARAGLGVENVEKAHLRPGFGVVGCIFESGRAEIVNDLRNDPRYVEGPGSARSLICAPLMSADRTMGVINVSSTEQTAYTAADMNLLKTIASHAASSIENAILHEKKLKQERVKSNLERYLSPHVVQAIIDADGDISMDPGKKRISVLFSDIRNFTTICEELAPEQVVKYMNEYFTHLVEVIFNHEGTVNKFVGDMIVALFGAPSTVEDNEKRAIEAAIKMQRRIEMMPSSWIKDNFNTGIGINSGDVVVGNVGSPQHMDYTAIGDEVNIASRLQSLARGGQILVSQSVYECAAKDFEFRELGDTMVKGKKKSVHVFEVVY